jgi:hypothetical protein
MPIAITEENLLADKSFYFTITTSGSSIIVEPKAPVGEGQLPGGHARINNRGVGARWLIWESSQQFQILFAEMTSSGGGGDGDVDDLFKEHQGPQLESGDKWRFRGKLRKGSGWETIAYKYTVTVGAASLDPLIIVDR